ncbi:MAG: PGF-pre-PGF domain-containing protein [archaeon]
MKRWPLLLLLLAVPAFAAEPDYAEACTNVEYQALWESVFNEPYNGTAVYDSASVLKGGHCFDFVLYKVSYQDPKYLYAIDQKIVGYVAPFNSSGLSIPLFEDADEKIAVSAVFMRWDDNQTSTTIQNQISTAGPMGILFSTQGKLKNRSQPIYSIAAARAVESSLFKSWIPNEMLWRAYLDNGTGMAYHGVLEEEQTGAITKQDVTGVFSLRDAAYQSRIAPFEAVADATALKCASDSECSSGICKRDYAGKSYCAPEDDSCVHAEGGVISIYPNKGLFSSSLADSGNSNYTCNDGHWSQDPFSNNNTHFEIAFEEPGTSTKAKATFPIRARVNYATVDITRSVRSMEYTYDLAPGDNYISLYLQPTPKLQASILFTKIPQLKSVKRWDPDLQDFQKIEKLGNEIIGNDFEIKPGEGYVMTLESSASFKLQGTYDTAYRTLQLKKGKNLVGWASLEGRGTRAALASLGEAGGIWAEAYYCPPNTNCAASKISYSKTSTALTSLSPGKAYWITLIEDDTLSYTPYGPGCTSANLTSEAQRAQLFIYGASINCGKSGSSHFLEVNKDGNKRIYFNPCEAFGGALNWTSIEVPPRWLVAGVNSFKIHDYNSGFDDRSLIIGVDSNAEGATSTIAMNSLCGQETSNGSLMAYLKIGDALFGKGNLTKTDQVAVDYTDDCMLKDIFIESVPAATNTEGYCPEYDTPIQYDTITERKDLTQSLNKYLFKCDKTKLFCEVPIEIQSSNVEDIILDNLVIAYSCSECCISGDSECPVGCSHEIDTDCEVPVEMTPCERLLKYREKTLTLYNTGAGQESGTGVTSEYIDFQKISLVPSSDATPIQIHIQSFEECGSPRAKPPGLPEMEPQVYKYYLLEQTSKVPIQALSIDFRVQRQWVQDNNFGVHEVFLYALADGSWQRLKTSWQSEDLKYAYYSVNASGFGYFAIGGEIIPKEKAAAEPGSSPQLKVTASIPKGVFVARAFPVSVRVYNSGFGSAGRITVKLEAPEGWQVSDPSSIDFLKSLEIADFEFYARIPYSGEPVSAPIALKVSGDDISYSTQLQISAAVPPFILDGRLSGNSIIAETIIERSKVPSSNVQIELSINKGRATLISDLLQYEIQGETLRESKTYSLPATMETGDYSLAGVLYSDGKEIARTSSPLTINAASTVKISHGPKTAFIAILVILVLAGGLFVFRKKLLRRGEKTS